MRLKQRILKYFEENPGKFRGLNDLRRDLRLNKKEMSISRAVIRDLVSKGRIKRDPSGKYGIEGQESRTGVISVSPRGFGFVRTGDTELYVPPMKLGGAYNGNYSS